MPTRDNTTRKPSKLYKRIRCFHLCVGSFSENLINAKEKLCLNQCLQKMKAVELMFVTKLKESMEVLVMNDPALKQSFEQARKNKQ